MEPFAFELDPGLLLANESDLLEIVDALEREFEGSAFSWVVVGAWEDYEDFWVRAKSDADPELIDKLESRLKRGPVTMNGDEMRAFAATVAQTIWGAFVFAIDERVLSFGAFDSIVWEFETTDYELYDRSLKALQTFVIESEAP